MTHFRPTRATRGTWLAVLTAAVLALTLPARSQSPVEFILEAGEDQVATIAGRYGLTPVEAVDDDHRDVVLVTGVVTEEEADALELEVPLDLDVIGFERNRHVAVPEAPPAGQLNYSSAAILEELPDQTPVPYWGATAWRGYVTQPAARIVGVAEAHTRFTTGAGVVAIIDTGVDETHEALAGRVLPGYDFTRNEAGIANDFRDLSYSSAAILEDGDPDGGTLVNRLLNQSTSALLHLSTAAILETLGPLPEAFGHGTMVAGMVHLAAPTANILPLKAFHADGSSDTFNILRAIYYAVDNGADVINMSFSLPESSGAMHKALQYAEARRVLTVAAAGNAASTAYAYPASFSTTAGIGSTTDGDRRSAFSNYGNGRVAVAAPGEQLVTTYPGNRYAAVWGTSFSSGLVAGGGALLHGREPRLRQRDFQRYLERGAVRVAGLGKGRIDLRRSLDAQSSRLR